MESTGKTGRRRGIQSVGIGVRVLSALAAQRGATTLSAVAEAASLSASQTHRYLSSLIEAGMVKQEHRSGLYDLDAGAIRLGLAALSRIDIFKMADESFAAFAKATGHTVLVAVWGDAGPTVIRWFDGAPPVVTSLAIGSVLPPLRSATGRVFWAFDDGANIERLGQATQRAEKKAVPDFAAIAAQVRAQGFAALRGDLIPGLHAVAAPVFDLQGRLVLVASLLSYGAKSDTEEAKIAAEITDACQQLTEALGGAWPIG